MWHILRFSVCAAIALAAQMSTAFASHTPATDKSFAAVMPSVGSFATDTSHDGAFGARQVFSGDLSPFAQWIRMESRARVEQANAQTVCDPGMTEPCLPPEWFQLLDQMQGKSVAEKLEIANEAMNRRPYVPTRQNWHRAMYWESPFQFLRVGGQCQDYAIAKYELLREAGLPADQLQMVVLFDSATGADHAVLVAYVDGQSLVLDNLRPEIVSANDVDDYRPYYAINETGWWRYVGGQAMAFGVAYSAR